jgi:ribosomal protein S27AE
VQITIEDKTLDPKKCLNCGESNSVTMLYCGKCGFVLKEEEAKRQVAKQRLLEEMMKAYQERIEQQEKEKKNHSKKL